LTRLLALPLSTLALLAACGSAPASRPAPAPAARYNGEGLRRLERGDLRGAEELFRDALREAELLDDLQGQAEAWNNLGALSASRGALPDARAQHAVALRLYLARGSEDPGLLRTRTNLGSALLALDAVNDAESQFNEAIALASRLGQPDAASLARVGLATIALRRSQPQRALELARNEVALARRANLPSSHAAALTIEAAALELLGQLEEARLRLEEALSLDRKREHPPAVREDLRALARLRERQGARSEAASYLARAARVSRRMEDLDAARSELRRAIELLGDGPEASQLRAELEVLESSPSGR
jgi:tetratricopeptide (TPR) repeat protein